jgi:hypothetical protein
MLAEAGPHRPSEGRPPPTWLKPASPLAETVKMYTDVSVEPRWSLDELRTLDEAGAKLTRRVRLSLAVGLLGAGATIATFLVSRTGTLVSLGVMTSGLLYAIDSTRKLHSLDELEPGTPVNADTLGVSTLVDSRRPPTPSGFLVMGGLILFVGSAIVSTLAR